MKPKLLGLLQEFHKIFENPPISLYRSALKHGQNDPGLSAFPGFVHHEVEGRHHVHLTNPERVWPVISDFLDKVKSNI